MEVKLELRNGKNKTMAYKYNDIINSAVVFQFQICSEIVISDIPEDQETNITKFVSNLVEIYEMQEQNQILFKEMKNKSSKNFGN